MNMALDSIEKALEKYPRENHRHGIVHCQITDKDIIDRYSKMGVIAYIQPIFLDYDIHIIEDRVGKERSKYTYNFKRFLDNDVNLCCGSDCPVEPLNVINGIYCATQRKDLKGYPKESWLPEQKISLDEAIYGFTMGGAYASFEENIKGSIEENKLADFIILSHNLYEIEPSEIQNVYVENTFVGGKKVYKK